MPISIDLNAEIASALTKNAAVKTALAEQINAALGSAKVNIPKELVDQITDQVSSSIKIADPASIAAAMLESMETKPKSFSGKVKARAGRIAKPSKSTDPVVQALFKYCSPGLPPENGKQNVRLGGEAGSGKTVRARTFMRGAGFDRTYEVPCLADMEPRDFIAGPAPSDAIPETMRIPYVDGPLAKAWRDAAAGLTVCLLIDEFGNVPKTAKQAFQTALSPYGEWGNQMVRLCTGRTIEAVDAKGNLIAEGAKGYHRPYQEEIEAPFRNITIIGTQNIGAEYDCPEDSPAIKRRLMMIPCDCNAESVRTVTTEVMENHFSWSKSVIDAIANSLVDLWRGSVDAKSKSLLDRNISIAEMIVALNQISYVTDDANKVSKALRDQLLSFGFDSWFVSYGHEGKPMKEQMTAWAELVKAKCPVLR